MRLRRALACAGIALMIVPGCATTPADSQNAALDAELAAIVDDPSLPLASLSVLAIRRGAVVYERQFGRRFIDEAHPSNNKPATRDTLYRIASISKLVTTLGVMRLVEAGKLSLDTDVSEYLGWKLRNPHFPDKAITLRMLLTHTSSLRDDAGYYGWPPGMKIREFFDRPGEGKMWSTDAAPGAAFRYANLPWGLVGTVMERVSGERFDRLMQHLVLEPLGMGGGFEPAEFTRAQLDNLAVLYRKRAGPEDREVWNPDGPWVPQADDYRGVRPTPRAAPGYANGDNGILYGPQGNLRASAADLGRVMRMLIARGEIDGRRFLKPETVDAMLARQWQRGAGGGTGDFGERRQLFNAWGLGNQQFTDRSEPGRGDRLVEGGGFTGVGHLGDAYGLTGILVVDPAKGDGVVFLAGGVGSDPEKQPGAYSANLRYEERILTAVYRNLLR